MTLIRYNPLADFVPSTFGDFVENRLNDRRKHQFEPAVDIFKNEAGIEIQLIVPGLNKEDFIINLEDNRLEISGERNIELDDKTEVVKRESRYGHFSRVFNLNNDIKKDEIKASYENGILKLSLPFIEKKVTKATIKVK